MKKYKVVLNSFLGRKKAIYVEALSEEKAIAWVNLIINDKWSISKVKEVTK